MGNEVHTDVYSGGPENCQALELAMWLLGGLLDYLTYCACLAISELLSLQIWPVKLASQSMVGLDRESMTERVVDHISNHILYFLVTFLYIGNTHLHLIDMSLVNDVIMGREA